jgi:hypothetical protein
MKKLWLLVVILIPIFAGTSHAADDDYAPDPDAETMQNKVGFVITPELGINVFDMDAAGWTNAANNDVKQLQSLGWSNVSQTNSQTPDYIYGGIKIALAKVAGFSFGLGYRYFGASSENITANGYGSGNAYTTLTDTQQFDGNLGYIAFGFSDFIGRAKKNKIGINLEVGVAEMDGTDAFVDQGYNGSSYFNLYSNSAVQAQTNWYAATVAYDHLFGRHFSVGGNAGYKLCDFTDFNYTKADSNFSSNRVGDRVKNSSGGDFSYDFSGLIASVNVAYRF